MINILILGAGFGGIGAALKLEKKFRDNRDVKITLIDRNNFHLFTPSLYEVATVYGLIENGFTRYLRGSVCIPYGEILKNRRINFIQAEIKEINLKEKFVATGGEAKIDFDYSIIALGGETEFYGIPGVQEYAYNFKSVNDAIAIYKKLLEFQKGAVKSLKMGVIGGGFTGVELAAELACCLDKIIKKCGLDKKCVEINLFETGPNILAMIGEGPRKIIEQRLKKMGVNTHLNSAVTEVKSNSIMVHPVKSALPLLNSLEDLTGRGGAQNEQFNGVRDRGEFNNFDLIIWAGGVRGLKILENSGTKLTKKGTVEVNEFLQILNADNYTDEKIFAIGDSVNFIDQKTAKPIPATAYVAHGLADVAAENIIKHIEKSKLKPYKPFYDVWAAPVGGKWAYFHFKNFNIAGFWGYILRQLVDFRYFLKILPFNRAMALFFKDLVIFTKND